MEINTIEDLTTRWKIVVWSVIGLENPNIYKLRCLFKETCALLDQYSHETLVPKEISGLLLEMHNFSWWVSTFDATPIHNHYRNILTITEMLTGLFLARDIDRQQIESLIDQL